MKQQAEADERAQLPVTMAKDGASVETICRTLDMSKTPYSRSYIEQLVSDVQQKPEEPDNSDGLVLSEVIIFQCTLLDMVLAYMMNVW